MKNKFKMLPLALATVMFSACASDDASDNGTNGNGENVTRYLTVDLRNVGVAPGTRADNNYEYGTSDESKINKVRFYFFHANGSAYKLADGTNYLTKTLEDANPSTDGSNIEHITKATLVINGSQSAAPASVIAIVNPDALVNSGTLSLGNGAVSLDYIKTVYDSKFYDNKANDNTGKTPTNFVMSNSVYLNAGTNTCATMVAGYVANTEEEALAKPIDIYVERVAAKVTSTIDTSKGWALGDGDKWEAGKYGKQVGKISQLNDTPVYAEIIGWGLSTENGRAELEKQIDPNWKADDLGINPWSTADYHRSFWCKSSEFNTGSDANANHPVYHSFNDIKSTFSNDKPLYTLPNTMQTRPTNLYNGNNLTKFIVATKLRYQDEQTHTWKDAEICEYRGVEYLGQKDVLASIAQEHPNYYIKTTSKGVDTYTRISADNLEFTTTAPAGSQVEGSLKDYEVVAQLKNGQNYELYEKTGSKGDDTDYTATNATTVNKALASYEAQVRNSGYAYYYIPIKHLGDENKIGEYGIVRNHWYKINLQDMQGFGTPVYDPDKQIIPELPSNDKTYLAARINVLSWRVVNQNVNLDVTK